MNYRFIVGILLLFPLCLKAQTPLDALTMSPGQVCIAGTIDQQYWKQYWEGTRLRTNTQIGQVYFQTLSTMGAIGIGNKVNLLASLPYIRSKATQGQLAGQQGVQDLSVWLKVKWWESSVYAGRIRLFVLAGGSLPLSDYAPDYLPLGIGLHARTATLRLMADYKLQNGLYATIRASHTWRSAISLDRDAFLYNNTLYYTHKLPLSNTIETALLAGWRNGPWVATTSLEYADGLSGDDIRRNDMPFPSNRMMALSANLSGKYQGKHVGITLGARQILKGRNMGKATQFSGGLLYLFQYAE